MEAYILFFDSRNMSFLSVDLTAQAQEDAEIASNADKRKLILMGGIVEAWALRKRLERWQVQDSGQIAFVRRRKTAKYIIFVIIFTGIFLFFAKVSQ